MHTPAEPIRQDRQNGMTYKAIAEKYKIDPRTAKRYAELNLPLSELDHRPYASILDPYDPLIRAFLRNGPVFAKSIYRELRKIGYTGGYSILNRYVQKIIHENETNGIYPPDARRSRHLPPVLTLSEKAEREKSYAASHIQ